MLLPKPFYPPSSALRRFNLIGMIAVALVISIGTQQGYASNSSGIESVAALDLSQLPAGTKNSSAESIAFVSDTSLAIGLCDSAAKRCSLTVLRRDGNLLRPYASTSSFRPGRAIHASSDGRILITPFAGNPAMLFTPDLSERQELPHVFLASQSGNTAAGITKEGWTLYRVKPTLEMIRVGKGSLRSISDEAVVFQDVKVMHVETVQGAHLGSFSVKPEDKCYNPAYPLGTNRLYLDDCKRIRIVDFSGRRVAELHRPKGYGARQLWSEDGKRILFHNFGRKISIFRNAGEIALAVGTLGAGVADEQSNREEVLVVDTATGNSCFDWRRSFPEGSVGLPQDAAISASGEFVAIAANGTLSVYRLPEVCSSSKQ
jgi:hypothetical protein